MNENSGEYTMRVCVFFGGFLWSSLLAPCLRVGLANTHSHCVFVLKINLKMVMLSSILARKLKDKKERGLLD